MTTRLMGLAVLLLVALLPVAQGVAATSFEAEPMAEACVMLPRKRDETEEKTKKGGNQKEKGESKKSRDEMQKKEHKERERKEKGKR